LKTNIFFILNEATMLKISICYIVNQAGGMRNLGVSSGQTKKLSRIAQEGLMLMHIMQQF
jgi:hypothetical protein